MSRGIPKEEHMQAKELFKLLVREQPGPLLRLEGFCAPGQSWRPGCDMTVGGWEEGA